MKDNNATVLAGICLIVEEKLLDEFKAKPEFEKRTSISLSNIIGMDIVLVEYILRESFFFTPCEGCKGDMWRLKG